MTWTAISAAELLEKKIGPPTTETLSHRKNVLERIALDCARCGDTADAMVGYLKHKRDELELSVLVSDAALRSLAGKAFEAWWAENPVKGGAYDFVLGPFNGSRIGAFPLGEVSAVQGASGSGKSTLAYGMLLDQHDGVLVFGRATFSRDFLVVMLDRSANALQRTLDGMGLTADELPHVVLTAEQEQMPPADVLMQIWSQRQGTQVMFVEGLDLWCRDINSMHTVQQLLAPIQKFAQERHVAVIASIGAPKAKVGEGYSAPRDRAIGSTAWARKLDTVLDIVEDHETQERHVTLLSRNDSPQRWKARFEDGWLVKAETAIQVQIDAVPVEPARQVQARELHKRGTPQADIAARLQTSPRNVRRWLNGR